MEAKINFERTCVLNGALVASDHLRGYLFWLAYELGRLKHYVISVFQKAYCTLLNQYLSSYTKLLAINILYIIPVYLIKLRCVTIPK